METKPFYLSSEFWVSLVTALYLALNSTDVVNQIPDRYSGPLLALVAGLYTLSRGFAKQGVAPTKYQ